VALLGVFWIAFMNPPTQDEPQEKRDRRAGIMFGVGALAAVLYAAGKDPAR
jgi:hypothetical protein